MTAQLLFQLKSILQQLEPRKFEEFAACLLSKLLEVELAVAKAGSQHGGDAGPSGRQGRRFRIEAKRYSDKNTLSDREILGEVDHAIARDVVIEAWFLVATCGVSEQLEQDLLKKSDSLGLPIIVIDWKELSIFPSLAALCTSDLDIVEKFFSKETADLVRQLVALGEDALQRLKKDLESWSLGFENIRKHSIQQLSEIWNNPKTANAKLAQNTAGGAVGHKLVTRKSINDSLNAWWENHSNLDAPAVISGLEGVGKTWSALHWLFDKKEELPIVLTIPSGAFESGVLPTESSIKELIAKRFHEITQVRDYGHWLCRLNSILKRDSREGAVILIFIDGINQNPSAKWQNIFSVLQDRPFSSLVRLIITTRNDYFFDKINSLKRLMEKPKKIDIDVYDDNEFEQRLKAEGLSIEDLYNEKIIKLAKNPRLFELVAKYKEDLTKKNNFTVHRLLWLYGCNELGERALSENDWVAWLQEVANYLMKSRKIKYNKSELGNLGYRKDLDPSEVYQILSDIVDGCLVNRCANNQFDLDKTFVFHILGAALVFKLVEGNVKNNDVVQSISNWFDSISGFDEKSEILSAAVSILLEQSNFDKKALDALVFEWLKTQNISSQHRKEIFRMRESIYGSLLIFIDVVNHDYVYASAKQLAVNSLRQLPKDNEEIFNKIKDYSIKWLSIVSRDTDYDKYPELDKFRSDNLKKRIGFDESGSYLVLDCKLQFLDNCSDARIAIIPAIIEGFCLSRVLPIFERLGIIEAILSKNSYWNDFAWLCLLNNVDFIETANCLKQKAYTISSMSYDKQPELSHQVAILLLHLSGDSDNESLVSNFSAPSYQSFSYENHYLNNPRKSIFPPELRHAGDILNDKEIYIEYRIERAKLFFSEPEFKCDCSSLFFIELCEKANAFDVSKLDVSKNITVEDQIFKWLTIGMARVNPKLLADILRKKLENFSNRPSQQRFISGVRSIEHFLLINPQVVTAISALRLKNKESDSKYESFLSIHLLIHEIYELSAKEQIKILVEADLSNININLNLLYILKELNAEEAAELLCIYENKSKKQQHDLLYLFSIMLTDIDDFVWQWVMSFIKKDDDAIYGIASRTLARIDPKRFGTELIDLMDNNKSNLICSSNEDYLYNRSMAFMELDNKQNGLIEKIEPYLLLKLIKKEGIVQSELEKAIEVITSILNKDINIPEIDVNVYIDCNGGIDISHKNRPDLNDDDMINKFHEHIKLVEESGGFFYLRKFNCDDFEFIIETMPDVIDDWLRGFNENSSEFKQRVLQAEGFFMAVCEALLSKNPPKGAELWRVLRNTVKNSYSGKAKIDEMIHMIFRASPSRELDEIRKEIFDLKNANKDIKLLELIIAANVNNQNIWLDNFIEENSSSEINWHKQRAEKLKGLRVNNTLPIDNAWPEGAATVAQMLDRKNARWRWKEASAKYWWNKYWSASSDEEAYAAWILLLEVIDRRAYVWMNSDQLDCSGNPAVRKRKIHLDLNQRLLLQAMNKNEQRLHEEFLGRKIGREVSPWRRDDDSLSA